MSAATRLALVFVVLVLVSAATLVGCHKPTDENVPMTARGEMRFDYDRNDFRFAIPGGWHIDEEFTGSHDEVHFKTTVPHAGGYGRLLFKIEKDDRYSRDISVRERLEVLAGMMATSDQYGTDPTVLVPTRGENGFNYETCLISTGYLDGVEYVWADRANQRMATGDMLIRHHAVIFDNDRAFHFRGLCTVDGYEEFFGRVFRDAIDSFRLKLYDSGYETESREDMHNRLDEN